VWLGGQWAFKKESCSIWKSFVNQPRRISRLSQEFCTLVKHLETLGHFSRVHMSSQTDCCTHVITPQQQTTTGRCWSRTVLSLCHFVYRTFFVDILPQIGHCYVIYGVVLFFVATSIYSNKCNCAAYLVVIADDPPAALLHSGDVVPRWWSHTNVNTHSCQTIFHL